MAEAGPAPGAKVTATRQDAPPMLEMRGISKRFPGVTANDGVDFFVARGEVHGLLGENGAGKSTLMNILYGLVQPDEGEILVNGEPLTIRNPSDAVAAGIGMVHQHFMLVPDMTVAENIALGLRSSRHPFSDINRVAERVYELSRAHGLNVDPSAYVEDMSVGMKQRVEILKLLYRQANILILDEPTAVLTPQEWHELAQVLRSLVAEGRSVVFISHKLDELMEVADQCTILRDGRVVDSVEIADTDKTALARMMVGRDVVLRVPRVPADPGAVVLDVRKLSYVDDAGSERLREIDLTIREGEILGLAGVDGNGQQELLDVLLGLLPKSGGEIHFQGRQVAHHNEDRWSARSIAVIPEDRHRTGVALRMSLSENLIARDVKDPRFSRRGVLRLDAIRRHCRRLVTEYNVRTPSLDLSMRQLSGGNQQKAVIARELHRDPKLLIAVQPTRGLDVGAMEYVYERLLEHKRGGGATLLSSAELDEILSLSDRIAVICGGRIMGTLNREEADDESLGLLMAGHAAGAA